MSRIGASYKKTPLTGPMISNASGKNAVKPTGFLQRKFTALKLWVTRLRYPSPRRPMLVKQIEPLIAQLFSSVGREMEGRHKPWMHQHFIEQIKTLGKIIPKWSMADEQFKRELQQAVADVVHAGCQRADNATLQQVWSSLAVAFGKEEEATCAECNDELTIIFLREAKSTIQSELEKKFNTVEHERKLEEKAKTHVSRALVCASSGDLGGGTKQIEQYFDHAVAKYPLYMKRLNEDVPPMAVRALWSVLLTLPKDQRELLLLSAPVDAAKLMRAWRNETPYLLDEQAEVFRELDLLSLKENSSSNVQAHQTALEKAHNAYLQAENARQADLLMNQQKHMAAVAEKLGVTNGAPPKLDIVAIIGLAQILKSQNADQLDPLQKDAWVQFRLKLQNMPFDALLQVVKAMPGLATNALTEMGLAEIPGAAAVLKMLQVEIMDIARTRAEPNLKERVVASIQDSAKPGPTLLAPGFMALIRDQLALVEEAGIILESEVVGRVTAFALAEVDKLGKESAYAMLARLPLADLRELMATSPVDREIGKLLALAEDSHAIVPVQRSFAQHIGNGDGIAMWQPVLMTLVSSMTELESRHARDGVKMPEHVDLGWQAIILQLQNGVPPLVEVDTIMLGQLARYHSWPPAFSKMVSDEMANRKKAYEALLSASVDALVRSFGCDATATNRVLALDAIVVSELARIDALHANYTPAPDGTETLLGHKLRALLPVALLELADALPAMVAAARTGALANDNAATEMLGRVLRLVTDIAREEVVAMAGRLVAACDAQGGTAKVAVAKYRQAVQQWTHDFPTAPSAPTGTSLRVEEAIPALLGSLEALDAETLGYVVTRLDAADIDVLLVQAKHSSPLQKALQSQAQWAAKERILFAAFKDQVNRLTDVGDIQDVQAVTDALDALVKTYSERKIPITPAIQEQGRALAVRVTRRATAASPTLLNRLPDDVLLRWLESPTWEAGFVTQLQQEKEFRLKALACNARQHVTEVVRLLMERGSVGTQIGTKFKELSEIQKTQSRLRRDGVNVLPDGVKGELDLQLGLLKLNEVTHILTQLRGIKQGQGDSIAIVELFMGVVQAVVVNRCNIRFVNAVKELLATTSMNRLGDAMRRAVDAEMLLRYAAGIVSQEDDAAVRLRLVEVCAQQQEVVNRPAAPPRGMFGLLFK
ncbi:hypothetical protein [Rugamonas aquatica]|uniref:Uncharacterized protein n=1 Tax=Rugamonas aquatica TaxID=2743357 RepID=A0A6A7N6W8_9BURK|nr:hypothetical protein [Rugamonas aquatica]MQA40739.1 hypothetical protein [Rugamonas aquatica]